MEVVTAACKRSKYVGCRLLEAQLVDTAFDKWLDSCEMKNGIRHIQLLFLQDDLPLQMTA
jgi:hypothetical protein